MLVRLGPEIPHLPRVQNPRELRKLAVDHPPALILRSLPCTPPVKGSNMGRMSTNWEALWDGIRAVTFGDTNIVGNVKDRSGLAVVRNTRTGYDG